VTPPDTTDESEYVNDPGDARAPDPNAAAIERGAEQPGQGRDETDDEARSSLPPSSATRNVGPKSDVDRAQPYDEQPIGLRMHEQPLETDGSD